MADYETGAGDGYIVVSNANWVTARNAETGSTAYPTTTTTKVGVAYTTQPIYNIWRAWLAFDTSAIPAGATITSATLTLYGVGSLNNENDAYSYAVIVHGSQASTSTLTTADFDAIGFTAGSDTIAVGSWSVMGNNVFTLNAAGRSWVIPAGWTKLGVMLGHDLEDVAPDQQVDAGTYVTFAAYENTNSWPIALLTVTYEEAGQEYIAFIWSR